MVFVFIICNHKTADVTMLSDHPNSYGSVRPRNHDLRFGIASKPSDIRVHHYFDYCVALGAFPSSFDRLSQKVLNRFLMCGSNRMRPFHVFHYYRFEFGFQWLASNRNFVSGVPVTSASRIPPLVTCVRLLSTCRYLTVHCYFTNSTTITNTLLFTILDTYCLII